MRETKEDLKIKKKLKLKCKQINKLTKHCRLLLLFYLCLYAWGIIFSWYFLVFVVNI